MQLRSSDIVSEFICSYVVVIYNVADVDCGKTILNEDMIVSVVIEI